MWCAACDNPNPDLSTQCAHCGKPLAPRKHYTPSRRASTPAPEKTADNRTPAIVFLLGLALLVRGITMSVAVQAAGGMQVANLDLMSQRQLWVIGGGALCIAAFFLSALRR